MNNGISFGNKCSFGIIGNLINVCNRYLFTLSLSGNNGTVFCDMNVWTCNTCKNTSDMNICLIFNLFNGRLHGFDGSIDVQNNTLRHLTSGVSFTQTKDFQLAQMVKSASNNVYLLAAYVKSNNYFAHGRVVYFDCGFLIYDF